MVLAQKLAIASGVDIAMKLLENLILIDGQDLAIFLNNIPDFVGFLRAMLMYRVDLLCTRPAIVPNPKMAIVDSSAKNGYRKLAGLVKSSDCKENVKLDANTFPNTIMHSMVGKTVDR